MFAPSALRELACDPFILCPQVLDVASSSLNAANCSAAPDCAALNRGDCGTHGLREANTCGECASGSVGVLGAANLQCVDLTELDSSCSNEAMVREGSCR